MTKILLKTGGLTIVLASMALLFLFSTGQPAFGRALNITNKKHHHHKRNHRSKPHHKKYGNRPY